MFKDSVLISLVYKCAGRRWQLCRPMPITAIASPRTHRENTLLWGCRTRTPVSLAIPTDNSNLDSSSRPRRLRLIMDSHHMRTQTPMRIRRGGATSMMMCMRLSGSMRRNRKKCRDSRESIGSTGAMSSNSICSISWQKKGIRSWRGRYKLCEVVCKAITSRSRDTQQ